MNFSNLLTIDRLIIARLLVNCWPDFHVRWLFVIGKINISVKLVCLIEMFYFSLIALRVKSIGKRIDCRGNYLFKYDY